MKVQKIYANVHGSRYELKDSKGESLAFGGSRDATSAVVRALQSATQFTRGKVYVFTEDRRLVNQVCGVWKVKDKERLKALIEIKLLSSFFECVRFFYVKREVTR